MAHSRTEYWQCPQEWTGKGDAGLRFESLLVSKPSFFMLSYEKIVETLK